MDPRASDYRKEALSMPKPAKKSERARRQRRAEAKANAKAPPVVRDPTAHRQAAAALVGGVVTAAQRHAHDRHREIAALWAEQVNQAQAEYLEETGEPMPMNLDEIHAAAVAEGRARALPALSDVIGDYTLADVHGMQSARRRERELLAGEVAKAVAAAEPSECKPKRSTKSKREELDGYYIGLVRRKAEHEGQAQSVVMAEIDGMTDQQFADVLLDEFSYPVCVKTVNRWRKATANAKREARSTQDPEPAVEDREHPVDRTDREDARQCGLSSRSRIDGITRRSKATLKEREREAIYRQAEELGDRLLEAHKR
jgi:hypothetical protein